MSRKDHIFTVVPGAAVQEEVDWRLPVFESGKYLVAFDGAALPLLELWRMGPGGGRKKALQHEEDGLPKGGPAGTSRKAIEIPGGSA